MTIPFLLPPDIRAWSKNSTLITMAVDDLWLELEHLSSCSYTPKRTAEKMAMLRSMSAESLRVYGEQRRLMCGENGTQVGWVVGELADRLEHFEQEIVHPEFVDAWER